MKDADISPLIVASVPFLGGILAMTMAIGLYLRVTTTHPGTSTSILFAPK